VFYPNRYGEVPLINDEWVNPRIHRADVSPSTPNDKYFEHIDWVVEQMLQRDIVPFLVPTWGRFINTGG
jgi:hypothetical protein